MTTTADDLEAFVLEYQPCGQLEGDADESTPEGYRVWLACPCGPGGPARSPPAIAEQELAYWSDDGPEGGGAIGDPSTSPSGACRGVSTPRCTRPGARAPRRPATRCRSYAHLTRGTAQPFTSNCQAVSQARPMRKPTPAASLEERH
jgi:hypothetical protein